MKPQKSCFFVKENLKLMINSKKSFALWLLAAMLLPMLSFAQVTTGSISGTVKDSKSLQLAGATVEAIHEPSGSKYKTTTSSSGRFNFPTLRVGGPYTVTIKYVGLATESIKDLYIQLGEPSIIDVALADSKSNTLKEVVVIGEAKKAALISKDKKGVSTNIGKRLLTSMPTLNRSITDFTKLTPQSNGTSFAGQDNRAINFTLDGSIFNNSFGLQALNGSQTNSTPISLDAIEEIQVNLSPYNLKESGFTGASINAVTKSGTNTLHGTGFYNMRNEGLVGTKAGSDGKQSVVTTAFDVKQFGVSFGGPILKNKLFYFVNYEGERRTDPATTYVANNGTNTGGGNVSRVTESDLKDLSGYLKEKLNYNTGRYQDYPYLTSSDKAVVKIDYNINDKNKLSIRGNALKSKRDISINSTGVIVGTRNSGVNSMVYENAAYEQNNDLYSIIGNLSTRISNKINNEVIFGYTRNNDYRAVKGSMFPTVDIQKDGATYISFGNDANTPNNVLYTNTWQFSDNLSFYLGKHTITTGLNFESFTYTNGFTPRINGIYTFKSIADFKTAVDAYIANPSLTTSPVDIGYSGAFSNLPNKAAWLVTTKARSIGAYVQDEITLDKKLNITYGIRFELPYFVGSGYANTEVDGFNFVDENGNGTKLSTSKLPTAKLMINPRVGFNYDVDGKKTTQIRGGAGLFTGRPQFVLISNQMGNNGVLSGLVDNGSAFVKNYPFRPTTPADYPTFISTPGVPAATYNIATTEQSFRFPQVFRTNLGIDKKVYKNIVASAEFMFTQSLSSIFYYNANLKPSTSNYVGPDNRPLFGRVASGTMNTTTNVLGGITTPATSNVRINNKITDATVLKSGPYGGSVTTTFKLEQPTKANGLGWMLAYNFTSAKDYITYGTVASSTWTGNRSINGNNRPDLAFSDNDLRNRLIANINYRKEISKFAAFQVSLFAENKNWGRFSYTYGGDMNGDNVTGNDLMYVPLNQSQMKFENIAATSTSLAYTEQQQKDAFDAYINQDDYLKTRRGKYAERNGALMPSVLRFDLSAVLELFSNVGKNRHTVQIRADIFNIGNMIDNKSGVGYVINQSSPLNFRGIDKTTNLPVYRMNLVNNSLNYSTYRKGTNTSDVWQAQLGIRYIF